MNINDLLLAFTKATLANIPLGGNYISEGISTIEKTLNNKNIEDRFQLLYKVILESTNIEDKERISSLLKTTTLDLLNLKLDVLYFSNGSSKEKAYDVFVNAWHFNAFPEIKTLSNQERLTFLVDITSRYAHFIKKHIAFENNYISDETHNRLINLIYIELSSIEKTGVRYNDLASIYLYLADLLVPYNRFKEAAHAYLACLENSIHDGNLTIGNTTSYRGTGSYSNGRIRILFKLGVVFQNLTLFDLSKRLYRDTYILRKKNQDCTKKRTLDCLLYLARLHCTLNEIEECIKVYEEYLKESEEFILKSNDYSPGFISLVWEERELASYYIMENKLPKPNINQTCLCGSEEPYKNCCFELIE